MPWYMVDLHDKVFQRVTPNAPEVPPRFIKIEAANEKGVRDFIREVTGTKFDRSWSLWKFDVEQALAARFVADKMAARPARDIAGSVVTKATKPLKKLHADGVSAKAAATALYEEWTR